MKLKERLGFKLERCGVHETIDGEKRLKFEGIFQVSDKVNKNNRIYEKGIWEKNLSEGSDFSSRLKSNKVIGELEHPESGITSLARGSHIFTGVKLLEDGKVHGEGFILDTPSGRILQEYFKVKYPVGASSRGDGTSTDKDGVEHVNDDYVLETFDFVADPSVNEVETHLVTESRIKELESKDSKVTCLWEGGEKKDVKEDKKDIKVDAVRILDKKKPISKEIVMDKKVVDRYTAVVEALVNKTREAKEEYQKLSEKVKKFESEGTKADPDLKKRYDTAKNLIAELSDKLEAVKKEKKESNTGNKKLEALETEMTELKKRYEAAKRIIAKHIDMIESRESGKTDVKDAAKPPVKEESKLVRRFRIEESSGDDEEKITESEGEDLMSRTISIQS